MTHRSKNPSKSVSSGSISGLTAAQSVSALARRHLLIKPDPVLTSANNIYNGCFRFLFIKGCYSEHVRV